MNQAELNHFKSLLVRKKQELQSTLQSMHDNGTDGTNNSFVDELSRYDNHPADSGSEMYSAEFNNSLKIRHEVMMHEINDALKKIDNGTYGKCESCGNDIDKERLNALPYAKFCIQCQNNYSKDRNSLSTRNTNDDRYLSAPFGRKYLNKREDDEHEGLDVLNDVMKYGSADTPQDMGGYEDYEEFYTNKKDKQGIVDKMDNISNQEYKNQLPD